MQMVPNSPCWIEGETCARISSLDAARVASAAHTLRRCWRASVLRGRQVSGLQVWECSKDHCWKQRNTTDILCPTFVAIRRYVHPASHRPTMRPHSNGWNCSTGVRTRRQCMVLPFSRLNIVNTVHLSKHHSNCLQSKTVGAKKASWAPCHDRHKWITNTTIPQYYYTLVPMTAVLEGDALILAKYVLWLWAPKFRLWTSIKDKINDRISELLETLCKDIYKWKTINETIRGKWNSVLDL